MTTATLATPANQDRSHAEDIIRAVYRQVFGNRHLMELDVQPSIEALFINGDLTVQGLVTALAQSESYRRLFLETNNPYRFVELNFKHLLGRPPRDQAEISEHVRRLADEGFEAEIASYTYSDEYLNNFGIDSVPYARTANERRRRKHRGLPAQPGHGSWLRWLRCRSRLCAAGEPGLQYESHGSGHQKSGGRRQPLHHPLDLPRSTGCRASLCPALGGELRLPVPHHSEHPGSGREHSFYCERLILVLIRPLRPDQSVMIGA